MEKNKSCHVHITRKIHVHRHCKSQCEKRAIQENILVVCSWQRFLRQDTKCANHTGEEQRTSTLKLGAGAHPKIAQRGNSQTIEREPIFTSHRIQN
jgi:hypothetical protein